MRSSGVALEGRTCFFLSHILPISPRANQAIFESLFSVEIMTSNTDPMCSIKAIYFALLDQMNQASLTLNSSHCLWKSLERTA